MGFLCSCRPSVVPHHADVDSFVTFSSLNFSLLFKKVPLLCWSLTFAFSSYLFSTHSFLTLPLVLSHTLLRCPTAIAFNSYVSPDIPNSHFRATKETHSYLIHFFRNKPHSTCYLSANIWDLKIYADLDIQLITIAIYFLCFSLPTKCVGC